MVRDRDTDQILAIKQINDNINNSIEQQTNKQVYNNVTLNSTAKFDTDDRMDNTHCTYESPEEMGQDTELDHSNISVIDITYHQQRIAYPSEGYIEEEEDPQATYMPLTDLEVPTPPLPPPLPFVNLTDSVGRPKEPNETLTNVSGLSGDLPNVSDKRRLPSVKSKSSVASSTNYKRNDSEVDYDEDVFKQRNEEADRVSDFDRNRFSIAEQVANNRSSFRPSVASGRESNGSSGKNGSLSNKASNLLSEIKLFNSGSLRPASKTSHDQPLIYEKNMDLLKEGASVKSQASNSTPSNSFSRHDNGSNASSSKQAGLY